MNDVTKQFEQFSEMMKAAIPQVKKVSKTGYEIRTTVLDFAQTQAWQDYHARWGQYETVIKKEGDQLITRLTMPEVPSVNDVLETANKFYEFVTRK